MQTLTGTALMPAFLDECRRVLWSVSRGGGRGGGLPSVGPVGEAPATVVAWKVGGWVVVLVVGVGGWVVGWVGGGASVAFGSSLWPKSFELGQGRVLAFYCS